MQKLSDGQNSMGTNSKHPLKAANELNDQNTSVITDANDDEGFGSTVTAAVIGIVIPVGKRIGFNL